MKKYIWLIPVIHAAFVISIFLAIPTMRLVYFGTPMYWSDWSSERCNGLLAYIMTSCLTAIYTVIYKFMP